MKKIFENVKEIIALLVIILLIAGVFGAKYIYNKNRKEKLQEYSKQLTSQSSEEINSTKSTLWQRINNFAGNVVHIDKTPKEEVASEPAESESSEEQNTLINFDLPSEYNSFVFDDRLLMYGGEQNASLTRTVLSIMIEDAINDFYSNPKLTVRNIGGFDGTIENNEDYISNLNSIKSQLDDNLMYNISFGYNKTKSVANEVIIEGK